MLIAVQKLKVLSSANVQVKISAGFQVSAAVARLQLLASWRVPYGRMLLLECVLGTTITGRSVSPGDCPVYPAEMLAPRARCA